MERRLVMYLAYMENYVKANLPKLSPEQKEKEEKNLLQQIAFFSHERLIHLIVTITFALLTVISLMGLILSGNLSLIALLVLLLVLLIPYVRHYYILENGVQKLYTYYDAFQEDYFTTPAFTDTQKK